MKQEIFSTIKRHANGDLNRNYFMLKDFREQYDFRNQNLSLLFDVICSVLNNIESGGLMFQAFKEDVLSKRDNPKEYYKELIKFAAQ